MSAHQFFAIDPIAILLALIIILIRAIILFTYFFLLSIIGLSILLCAFFGSFHILFNSFKDAKAGKKVIIWKIFAAALLLIISAPLTIFVFVPDTIVAAGEVEPSLCKLDHYLPFHFTIDTILSDADKTLVSTECWDNAAISRRNISLCSSQDCIEEIALAINDVSLCSSQDCIEEMALAMDDVSLCEESGSDYMRESCIFEIVRLTNGSVECESFKDSRYLELCQDSINAYASGSCDERIDESCLMDYKIQTDPEFCLQHSFEYGDKEECILHGTAIGGIGFCGNKLLRDSEKACCIATMLSGSAANECGDLEDAELRLFCETAYDLQQRYCDGEVEGLKPGRCKKYLCGQECSGKDTVVSFLLYDAASCVAWNSDESFCSLSLNPGFCSRQYGAYNNETAMSNGN